MLQILSLTLFEKLPLKQAVASVEPIANNPTFHSQLNYSSFNRTVLTSNIEFTFGFRSKRLIEVKDYCCRLIYNEIASGEIVRWKNSVER